MHILVASLSYDAAMGGGSVHLPYDLATGMARRGHRVTVVCEDLHGRGLQKETLSGVTVLRYCLPPVRGLAVRRHEQHLEAVRQLLDQYLDGPPDIVHGHSLFQYVAVLRRYRGQVCSCFTIHSPFVDELRIAWGAQGLKGRLKTCLGLSTIRRLERECLTGSDILTAESDFTRRLIGRYYGETTAARVRVVPGWVDLERFVPLTSSQIEAARKDMEWRNDRPVFFVLRRLEARMGLDNLLHALVLVNKRGLRPYTVIGGSGSWRTHLEKMRDKLGLCDDVCFMGFVPAAQLPRAYAACDASIIPTARLECFGIIALEALACGRPTLVTPVGALPEVMQNFEPRWVASDNTPEAIAYLICSYLEGKLPVHTPEELRSVIARRYTVERAITEYEQILTGTGKIRNK